MTFSDSLPVQFWLASESTFNETSVYGLVKQDCFCQPFQLDDEITIQYIGTSSDSYSMIVVDSNGFLIYDHGFSGVFTVGAIETFTVTIPANTITVEGQYALKIGTISIIDYNSGFDTDFTIDNTWIQLGSGEDWFQSTSQARVILSNVATSTKRLTNQYFVTRAAGKYKFNVVYVNSGLHVTIAIDLYLNTTLVQNLYTIDAATSGSINSYITATAPFNTIVITVTWVSGVSATFRVSSLVISEAGGYVGKSDCLDFKITQDCTKKIAYSNSSNFDNLSYADLSPSSTFYTRIPATFYEESNPQEQEDMELSDGQIVTIRQGIQQKKKLDIGYMPPYMHLKVQKVLMHETVTIDGTQWRRRDPYNAPNIPKYNLKKGDVLLTKYNSVEKNTI